METPSASQSPALRGSGMARSQGAAPPTPSSAASTPTTTTTPITPSEPGLNENGKRTLSAVTGVMGNKPLVPSPLFNAQNHVGLHGSLISEAPPAASHLHHTASLLPADTMMEDTTEMPGASWKNSRAQYEMSTAWEQIVDKDLMINKKYGDVMAPQK